MDFLGSMILVLILRIHLYVTMLVECKITSSSNSNQVIKNIVKLKLY